MLEKTVVAFFILLALPAEASFRVSGRTTAGMPFSGAPVLATKHELLLENGTVSGPGLWGIPLESIATISLMKPMSGRLMTMQSLEGFAALIPLWDSPTRDYLVQGVGELAESGQWQAAYDWSSRLLENENMGEIKNRLSLYRSWALFEMGLVEAANEAAAPLAESLDPMEMDERSCWLMAHLAIEKGEWDQAVKWSHLPSLQIPSRSGPLSAELASLIQRASPDTTRKP